METEDVTKEMADAIGLPKPVEKVVTIRLAEDQLDRLETAIRNAIADGLRDAT